MKKRSVAVHVGVVAVPTATRLNLCNTWRIGERRGFSVAVVAVLGNPQYSWASRFCGGACRSPPYPLALTRALGERRSGFFSGGAEAATVRWDSGRID